MQVDIFEALLYVCVPAIFMARMWHVVTDFEIYRNNIVGIIKIWDGGLSIWGALLSGFVGVVIYARKSKLNLKIALNYVATVVPLGQAIGRIGNWVNQELFGPPTDQPWGIYVRPENRPFEYANSTHFHPAFLYEMVGNFIVFMLLVIILKNFESKKPQILNKTFVIVYCYLLGYSLVRFMVEFFRIEDELVVGLSFNQLIALFIAIFSIIALWKNLKHSL